MTPTRFNSLLLLALAITTGCKNSDDGGGTGQTFPVGFGEGPLPQQFGVFLARDLNTGDSRLSVIDAETGELRALAGNTSNFVSAQGLAGNGTTLAPALSPDGRVVGLSAVNAGRIEYRLVAVADGRSVVIGSDPVYGQGPQGGVAAQGEGRTPRSSSSARTRAGSWFAPAGSSRKGP